MIYDKLEKDLNEHLRLVHSKIELLRVVTSNYESDAVQMKNKLVKYIIYFATADGKLYRNQVMKLSSLGFNPLSGMTWERGPEFDIGYTFNIMRKKLDGGASIFTVILRSNYSLKLIKGVMNGVEA